MDVLSDVLRVIRLSGAIFFSAEFTAPFALASPPSLELAARLLPTAECLALFHVLAQGDCWIALEGEAPLHMEQGDAIIFPHSHPHVMTSRVGTAPTPLDGMLPDVGADGILRMSHGGGGPATRFVCGFLQCDQRFNPLMGALPHVLWVRRRQDITTLETTGHGPGRAAVVLPPDAGAWLMTTLGYLLAEVAAGQPGCRAVLARLAELLFVDVLRRYAHHLPMGQTGWLAGLSDPQVGRALRLLHQDPAHAWTVESVARAAGVSRSSLALRFSELIGESPMHYLTAWRMHVARQMLREHRFTIPEVAARVGYQSEAAFNRAFKRAAGAPPGLWLKREEPRP
ncbi:MAG TPA: AraC family transcriptional regulator [Candidatus Methylomirabilis sp.]|nr:AraC family transcriptional regulator [Candidatus Methylomirabilis sp.]